MKIIRFTLLVLFALLSSGLSLAQNEPQILLTLYGYGPENNFLATPTTEGYSFVTRGSEMDISADRYLAYTISDGSTITSIGIIDLKTWLPYLGFDSSFNDIKTDLDQVLGRRVDLAFWSPKWSPDGQHLAFYVQNSQMDHPAIVIASRNSAYVLTLEEASLVGWKDAQHLLVLDRFDEHYGVWAVDINTTSWVLLGQLTSKFFTELEVSNGLVLVSNLDDGVLSTQSSSLFSNLELLVEGGEHAVWSPDGRQIAYNQNGDIWRAEADGSNATLVSNRQDQISSDLQWFGNRIYFKLQTLSFADGRVLISLASIRQDGTDFQTHFELPDRFWDLDFVVY